MKEQLLGIDQLREEMEKKQNGILEDTTYTFLLQLQQLYPDVAMRLMRNLESSIDKENDETLKELYIIYSDILNVVSAMDRINSFLGKYYNAEDMEKVMKEFGPNFSKKEEEE